MLERPRGPILMSGASTTHGPAEPVVAGAVKSIGGHAAVLSNGMDSRAVRKSEMRTESIAEKSIRGGG